MLRTAKALGPLVPGFGLIEVLLATSLVAVVAVGLAHLFVMALAANASARSRTLATALATQKMEQLRSLPWGYAEGPRGPDAVLGPAISDAVTDLSADPLATGGGGLSPSSTGSLRRNSPPFVDYLDWRGLWVGTGARPPPNTMFVRRWAVTPLPGYAPTTLVLQVVVVPIASEERRTQAGPGAGDVWLATVKTRKAR